MRSLASDGVYHSFKSGLVRFHLAFGYISSEPFADGEVGICIIILAVDKEDVINAQPACPCKKEKQGYHGKEKRKLVVGKYPAFAYYKGHEHEGQE